MMANIPRLNVRIIAEDSSVPVLESVPGAKRGAQPIRLEQKLGVKQKLGVIRYFKSHFGSLL